MADDDVRRHRVADVAVGRLQAIPEVVGQETIQAAVQGGALASERSGGRQHLREPRGPGVFGPLVGQQRHRVVGVGLRINCR